MNEKVAIVKTGGNDDAPLRNAVQHALDLLDLPLKNVGPGSCVVIKPNITADSTSWRQGIVTNPHLVRAIIECVAERNPREIRIAEAIAVGLDVKKAYSFLGYDKIAKDTGARLIDLYDEEFVDVPVAGSNLHSTLQIAKSVIEADFLINVPVMKTHVATGISVCMKNLMGTISREQKKKFHFFGIAESVVDLNAVVGPHLSIADGTVAGEGDGPMANEPVGFETILAGTDNRVVDIISAEVMGFEPNEIEILKICNDRWGALQVSDIEIVGQAMRQTLRPFKHAAECVRPPEGIECAEGGACAACTGVLELALTRAGQMDILEKLKPLRIVCGPDSSPPGAAENVLVVGKCLSHLKESGNFVPGCPPQVFLVADELREMAGVDRIFGCKDGYIF
ncbi:MAG: DUF362 domain-containing protein [Desulfobacterales bacterium]|jgi:uncharacterized protein (DUF362 family)